MSGVIRRIGRSIFFKLLLVFVTTAIVMALAVGTIVRQVADDKPYRDLIGKNMAQYASYIIQAIGDPPDNVELQQFAETFGVAIQVESSDGLWKSDPPPPTELPNRLRIIPGFEHVQGARFRGRIYLAVDLPDYDYLFVFGQHGDHEDHDHGKFLILTVLVVALILLISYLVVRWLLRPLQWLTDGMQSMGKGNLDTSIPIRKHDELGDLAARFNDMSVKIKNQVRAREQLLLDVSHELRSPMTRMKVAAEFIGEDKVKRLINADLDEMEAMTAEILESERLNSDQGGLVLEQVDLRQLVMEIAGMYQERPPGVQVEAGESAIAIADRERVRVLLRNIMDNAFKYSGEQAQPIQVRVSIAGDRVQIVVQDFGEGIPAEDLSLLFEPFYRVDKSRGKQSGGFGLGLSLCRKIMDAHEGSIEVDSATGKGTSFTITFLKNGPEHINASTADAHVD